MFLLSVERLIFRIIFILAIFNIVIIYKKSISIDVAGYTVCCLIGLLLMALGQFYRISERSMRLGNVLTASGLYVLFTIVGSIFNYVFLPIYFHPIDDILMRVDNFVGYSWPAVVTWAATYPWIGTTFYVVYMTSLPQLLVILITLGFTGKETALHSFLLTGTIGALLSIAFWVLFPTFGAKAYHTLPEWVLNAIPLAVDPAYGQELVRLGLEGVDHLSPANILGLIGFPSFHIFMALMSVFFVPRHVLFIVVIGALNILMFPAVLVQGGHHLSDVFGGMACFAVAFPLSRHIVKTMSNTPVYNTAQQRPLGVAAE